MSKRRTSSRISNNRSAMSDDLNASFASTSSSKGKFEVPSLTLESSVIYERKFVVASATSNSLNIYKLRHPKETRPALYQIDNYSIAEVLQIDGERSCFYGNLVVKDCVVTILSPIHPLFLVLPNLMNQTNSFKIGELTNDLDFPALALLNNIPGFIKALKLVCNFDENDTFNYNAVKLNVWLKKRFNLLLDALKVYDGVSESIKSSDESLRYFAFELFSDYIPDSLSNALQAEWKIQKPLIVKSENLTVTKRKLEVTKTTATKKKDNKVIEKKRKVMTEASKGTMKLSGFFNQ